MFDLTPTISVLEVLYALVAVYGLVVTALNAWDAWGDYQFIKQRTLNGGRRIVARGHIRRECLRMCQLAACLAIAVYAMTRPPQTGVHALQVLIVPLCLIVIEVTCTINSASDRHDRIALISLLNAIYHAKATGTPLPTVPRGETGAGGPA